jgi:hypothetical protein
MTIEQEHPRPTKKARVTVELQLDYRVGEDEPQRGIYRNSVVPPKFSRELMVAVRRKDVLQSEPYNSATDGPPQVHIAGSPRALEELGRYLVALARLDTQDPEPYGWMDNVPNADGGTARVVLRRLSGSEP